MAELPSSHENENKHTILKVILISAGAIVGGFLGIEFLPVLFHTFGVELHELVSAGVGGVVGEEAVRRSLRRLRE